MEIRNTGLTHKSTVLEYNLEGGVIIQDKTNGIARAFFSEISKRSGKPLYKVVINDKPLTYPTGMGLQFAGSKKITFKQKNEFIKIIEVDAVAKTIFYVDPRNTVEGSYNFYCYIPTEMALEDAMKKTQNLKTDFPNFKGDIAVYNRHGVAIFGWNSNNYALCWANPSEEKVHMIPASCGRFRDGGSSFGKSNDGKVNFVYDISKGDYLNAEPATRFSLEK